MIFPHLSRVAFAGISAAIFLIAPHSLAAETFERISTEAEFSQLVVGKKLTLGKNWFVIRKNGSLKGDFNGEKLKGAWQWRDGYWCRTLKSHSKNTDCQLWEVSGDEFRVTRAKGKGKSFTYIVK